MEQLRPQPLIEFDRGTIVVSGVGDETILQGLVTWDPRTNVWRAPAYTLSRVARRLREVTGGVRISALQSTSLEGAWTLAELRPYQEAALIAWRAAGGQGIVCLPTGAGKTRIAVEAMRRVGRSTLCLVPTRVLLHQWHESLREHYTGDIGILGDGQRAILPITIATYESAYRSGWWLGHKFHLLVVDEAHHFGDGQRDEALESCAAPFRLGLSATVEERQWKRLADLIGPKVYEQEVMDLSGKFLAEFELIRIHLTLTHEERVAYEADYAVFQNYRKAFRDSHPGADWETFLRLAMMSPIGRTAVAAFHRARRMLFFTKSKRSTLLELLGRLGERRTLVFAADAATAIQIARSLLLPVITADTPKGERHRILTAFAAGSVTRVVSCKVLNEGIDVPCADAAIILGGSSAAREHIQRVGRVLRQMEGKKALVYELLSADTLEVRQSERRGRAFNAVRSDQHVR